MSDFAVFSDESRHNTSRFRSIAAVSVPITSIERISERIAGTLASSGASEFKWQNLTSEGQTNCAVGLVDVLFDDLLPVGGRVDVLTWDTRDSRHDIVGRDDAQNFERMFFHLHDSLMAKQDVGTIFHLYPDERCDINWKTIHDCLAARGRGRIHRDATLLDDATTDRRFLARSLRTVDSVETPLCQLADLFAGMAPYTMSRPTVVRHLLAGAQQTLFGEGPHASVRDRARFPVIKHLHHRCEAAKLGVSLRSEGYLVTRRPGSAVNFWPYTPQHELDRAPTRVRSTSR